MTHRETLLALSALTNDRTRHPCEGPVDGSLAVTADTRAWHNATASKNGYTITTIAISTVTTTTGIAATTHRVQVG